MRNTNHQERRGSSRGGWGATGGEHGEGVRTVGAGREVGKEALCTRDGRLGGAREEDKVREEKRKTKTMTRGADSRQVGP